MPVRAVHRRTRYAAALGTIGLVGAALALTLAPGAAADPRAAQDLAAARAATGAFHDLATARHAGYGILRDTAGIACIDLPGTGAMGVHFVDGGAVGDPTIAANHPEAVVYEPQPDGRMRLVAVEYVVIKAAWDGLHADPPSLFGQEFMETPAGNRFGLPAFYSLHAWVWQHNPAGTFEMWNPDVSCAAG